MKGIKVSKGTIKKSFGFIVLIILSLIITDLWHIVDGWLLDFIFNITTLGLSSLSDAFYEDVGKGLHEEPSVFALYILWFGCIYVFASRWGDMRVGKYNKERISKEEEAIVNKISDNEDLSPEEKQVQIEEAKSNFYEKMLRSYKMSCIRTKIILIFLAVFVTFQCFTILYRNQVITRFLRAFSATKFAMSEEQEDLILFQFSIIQNKQDYLNILNTLEKTYTKALETMKEEFVKEDQKPEKEFEDTNPLGTKDKTK